MSDIQVSFFCVQPIKLSNNLNTKLLLKKVPFSKVDKYTKRALDQKDGWYKQYNHIYDSYKTLREIKLDSFPEDLLLQDLSEDKFIPHNHNNKQLPLAEYLDTNKTDFTLFFDTRFSYFILVYEIYFTFPKIVLNDFLHYENPKTYDKKDLYNTIRNLIVKEESNSSISVWGSTIRSKVINKIKTLISGAYNIKSVPKDISISNNSCNISCFILDTNEDDLCLVNKFNDLNKNAERLITSNEIEGFYNNSVYYSFNGRFHTIYLKNKNDKFRFQPLQFHIQFIWFLVERYNKLMNRMNLDLMQNSSMKNLRKYADTIHIMINKIEFLSLHDSNFKHSIEIDYQNIYSDNEKKWSIENSLSSSKKYVSFLKDYLERLFNQKNDLFQKRQNRILFLISTLQLVALLSVWGDYLQLLKNKGTGLDERLKNIFQTPQELLDFNLYLPIYIGGFIVLVFLYLFFRRR